MSSPQRKLYGVARKYGITDDVIKAVLLGQTGRESARGLTWSGANACVAVFENDYAPKGTVEAKKKDWRPTAQSPHARKIYALWGILRRNHVTQARYPDGYVKRMTDRERAEWLTPDQCNIVIEGLIDWIKRDGFGHELK